MVGYFPSYLREEFLLTTDAALLPPLPPAKRSPGYYYFVFPPYLKPLSAADLVCVKRDLVCVKRDLVCVKRDLLCNMSPVPQASFRRCRRRSEAQSTIMSFLFFSFFLLLQYPTYIHVHVYTYIYTYMYTHTYRHTHRHTHTHSAALPKDYKAMLFRHLQQQKK
jgi:hypothetical protein